jgi:hypothetical protein
MEFYRNYSANMLSDAHSDVLERGSAISPEVTGARGVWTINRPGDLPEGYNERQRRRTPGMLFAVHRPNGKTTTVYRPDEAYAHKPGWKYEQVPKESGGGNVLDVHPFCREWIGDKSVPVLFVEGTKKADALITAFRRAGERVVVVAIVGVWNWLHDGGKPIEDMYAIPLEGRSVTVMFDSDVLSKWQVQLAAKRLAEHAEGRGAKGVYMTYFPHQEDGSKTGADDYFAAGGTLARLRLLTRRYDPADFIRVRLHRDEQLRAATADLERRFWAEEWKGMGGHSDRDVYLMLIEAARQYGSVHPDGIRVQKAQGPLALEAKVSTRTLWKALNRLEERGLIYRDNEGRKPDKSGAFVLRASVSHYRTEKGIEDNVTSSLQASYARDLHLRAELKLEPRCRRLRWSQPRYTPRRGLVSDSRKVRQSQKAEPRPAIKRLGKIRGAILDALDAAGGTLTLQEIADTLHRSRPRDIRRRNLPMLEGAGIIQVNDNVVSLADNWLEALEEQRELGGEVEAEELAWTRYKLKSRAYHNRDKAPASKPSAASLEAIRRSRESKAAGLGAIAERAEAAAKPEEQRKAEAFLRHTLGNDKLLVSGGIRLGHLCDIWHDAGGDPLAIPRAIEALGCRVERLPQYGDRKFVFPPAQGAA